MWENKLLAQNLQLCLNISTVKLWDLLVLKGKEHDGWPWNLKADLFWRKKIDDIESCCIVKTYEEKHSTETYEPAERIVAKWINFSTYFISFRNLKKGTLFSVVFLLLSKIGEVFVMKKFTNDV